MDLLEMFDRIFYRVEELVASISVHQTGDISPFGQLFPQLRRLSVTLEPDADYSYIDCLLPRLEQFSLKIVQITGSPRSNWSRMDQIEGLLWRIRK